jgi:protein O-mannosyl-transferase
MGKKPQQNKLKKPPIKKNSPVIPSWAPYALIAATALIYARAVFNDFGNLDDDLYVINNPVIRDFSWNNLKAIFSSFYVGMYEPLSMLTYMIDYAISGLNPFTFHFTNVLLHIINSWLVYKFIDKLSGNKITALLVAALFALHPMHVESVAWVSERKDVLYSLFYLLSLLAYLKYLGSGRKLKLYLTALLLFILSLLSKSAAVTLPILLIAIEIYKGRKVNFRMLAEKIPFLLLSVLFGIISLFSQKSAQAINEVSIYFNYFDRIFLFTYGIAFYLIKLIVPFNLCVMHYYPDKIGAALPWEYYASLPFLLILGFLIIRRSFFRKDMIFGFAFFLIAISVMLQIISVGPAIAAERYTYISYIGLFFIFGQWIAISLKKKIKNIVLILAAALFIVFACSTWMRIGIWRNGDVLLGDVIKKNPDNYVGYWIRANMKMNRGDMLGAMVDFDKTLKCKPDYLLCIKARGDTRIKLKDFKGALDDLNLAISRDSNDVNVYTNRGKAYFELGNRPAALKDCDKAIQLDSTNARAFNNRSLIRGQSGDVTGALADINKAIRFSPSNDEGYSTRANIKFLMNDLSGAIADYNISLTINPGRGQIYYNRGYARLKQEDKTGACKDWEKSVQLGFEPAAKIIEQYCR